MPMHLARKLRKKHGLCQSRKLLRGTKQADRADLAWLPHPQIHNCNTTIAVRSLHSYSSITVRSQFDRCINPKTLLHSCSFRSTFAHPALPRRSQSTSWKGSVKQKGKT